MSQAWINGSTPTTCEKREEGNDMNTNLWKDWAADVHLLADIAGFDGTTVPSCARGVDADSFTVPNPSLAPDSRPG